MRMMDARAPPREDTQAGVEERHCWLTTEGNLMRWSVMVAAVVMAMSCPYRLYAVNDMACSQNPGLCWGRVGDCVWADVPCGSSGFGWRKVITAVVVPKCVSSTGAGCLENQTCSCGFLSPKYTDSSCTVCQDPLCSSQGCDTEQSCCTPQ